MPNSSFIPSKSVYCSTIDDYWQYMSSSSDIYLNLAQLLLFHPKNMDKTAVASPDGDLTYRFLFEETCRTASALEQQGLQPGERVLIALNDDHMQLCLTLGCWAVGAIPILINPQITLENLTPILKDIIPVMCIVRDDHETDARIALDDTKVTASLLAIPPHAFLTDMDYRLTIGDPAWHNFYQCNSNQMHYIQYSSGTTGTPKGVMLSAQNLLAFTYYQMVSFLGFITEDVIYTIPHAFFSYGILLNLTIPLCINATTVRDSRWPNAKLILENIQHYRPSLLLGVPLHFQCLLDNAKDFPQHYTPRFLLSGGAPLSSTIIKYWYNTFGTWLHNAIGSSEALGAIATTYPHNPLECMGSGYVTPSCKIRLLNENKQPVSLGHPGELWVHNTFLALGYWNNPELTAQKFHHDEAGQRWYATGDMFSEDEQGCLYFKGRTDDCFKIKGRWVTPIEIEETVLQRIPSITNCLLIEGPMDNGLLGTVLFIEAHYRASTASLDHEVRAALSSLESYKHPTCCHTLSHLPTNANGKPDRNILRQQVPSILAQHITFPI